MGARPQIMGILNVTPDSFSDGGRYLATGDAVDHALRMVEEGADIIDVGGESTRPGAMRQPAAAQLERVLPVIRGLRKRLPEVPISIDTTLAEVARAAVADGANMINDISAGRDDVTLFDLAAKKNLPMVLMHMQGTPETMQRDPEYVDVVAEILAFLLERAAAAEAAGIPESNIILDPGIGFGKTLDHNLAVIQQLERFVATGYRVMLGASRKRFLRLICGAGDPKLLAGATAATTAIGVLAGVGLFRVHDVRENRQAADLASRIAAG